MDAYLAVLHSGDHSDTFSGTHERIQFTIESVLLFYKLTKSIAEAQLLAICVDLFVAGSETTSKSLAFGLMYLILYPEAQRKAQEEIDRVIGRDRSPTLADRPR